MKQFKLREKKEFIKILKEPPTPKKKTNWSGVTYLIIFAILLSLFLKRLYNGNINIFADGQIELPKQTINFSNDIEIQKLFIEEGKVICKGDTLFVYKIIRDEIDQANLTSKNLSNGWITKEILSIKKKIKLNKILIDNKNQVLTNLNKSLELKESLLLSGIHNEYDQYSDLQAKKLQLFSEVEFLQEEIEMLKNHLYTLSQNDKYYQSLNYNTLAIYNEIKYYIAPIDGVISDVFYEENEICYKKEEMMTIHQLKDASIITYFDTEEINHLNIGDVVDISFPDGHMRKGVINKFFVSTYALPSEFQKKYEPTERNIVAQVIPLDKTEELSWQKFYKMDVKIKKKRYNFL